MVSSSSSSLSSSSPRFGPFVLFLSANLAYRLTLGRAVAQADSRWLPTAMAKVRALAGSCGICGGRSGTGAGFHWALRFPLPLIVYRLLDTHNHPSSGAGTIGPIVAEVPSGLSLTPPRETKKLTSGIQCVLFVPVYTQLTVWNTCKL
jgi:hypothetical protein